MRQAFAFCSVLALAACGGVASEPAAEQPDVSGGEDTEAPLAPAATTPIPMPMGTSEEDAVALCASRELVGPCQFREGLELPNGTRVDVMVIALSIEEARNRVALVFRSPGAAQAVFQDLAEAFEVGSQAAAYHLGSLEVDGEVVSLGVSTTRATYPDPSAGETSTVESTSQTSSFRCAPVDGVYACARQEL